MSTTFKNPAFQIGGYRDLHWVEKDEPGEFRDANDYLEDRGYSSLAGITGYYCDDYCEAVAVPAVFVTAIVCDDCMGAGCDDCEEGELFTYYAGMHNPHDSGSGVVDDSETYDDPEDAAKAAHGVAERYAEHQRDYQEKCTEYQNAADAQAEAVQVIREARAEHSAFIGAMTKYADGRCSYAVYVDKRKAAREDVARAAKIIRDARAVMADPRLKEFAS